jgi:hypothetical protein
MSKEALQPNLQSLINPLIDLAGEIDGVADFGMTVCYMNEETEGRHQYIAQRCERIQLLVDSVISAMNEMPPLPSNEMSALQADVVAGTALLLNGFRSLERLRSLAPDSVRSSTDAVRAGWETVHRVIRIIADALDAGDQSWYVPIRERQGTYRTQLEQVGSCFYQEALTSRSEQSPLECETAERPIGEH